MTFKRKPVASRRDFLRLASLASGAAVLAACSPAATEEPAGGGDTGEESSGGDEPAAEPGEIVWWWGWGQLGPAVETINASSAFQDHIGNNTLTWRESVQAEDFLTAFAAGEPPDGGSNNDYPGFWARGVAVAADDLVAGSTLIDLDDLMPALVEGAKYDGQMIGVISVEGFIWWGLNYNAAHVEEAGLDPDNPPHTFEDLLEWHRQMTLFDDAGNLTRLGLDPYDAMAGEPDFPAFSHGLNWWNDEEQTFNIDDPRMAEAMDTFAEFYRIAGPDQVGGMRSVEGQGTWGAAYSSEVQSMIIEGYWHPGETTFEKPDVAANNRATWAPVPASRAGTKLMATGAHYVQLYKDGKNIDGMFKVAEYLNTTEALDAIFNEVGWLTGKLSYLETVDVDAYPGLDFYMEAVNEADEWIVGRRSPIHWFVAGQFDELKEQVYRDLMTSADAVAELQKRDDDEWAAQDLG